MSYALCVCLVLRICLIIVWQVGLMDAGILRVIHKMTETMEVFDVGAFVQRSCTEKMWNM